MVVQDRTTLLGPIFRLFVGRSLRGIMILIRTTERFGRSLFNVCVCVFWPPTGRVFPTIGVSTRRAGLPPKPPPQGLLIPTLGTVPRLLYYVSERSPAEATAARSDGELLG